MGTVGLVGRGRELDAVCDLVRGDATVVLISGDAGIGKSRLVTEVLSQFDRTLIGGCLPMRRKLALLPFQDMFAAEHDRSQIARAVTSMPPVLAAGLVGLLPARLVGTLSGARTDAEPEVEQVFAGVSALFKALGMRGPVIGAVEDVHWADSATLDLLTYLMATLHDSDVTLLATHRTDGLEPRSEEFVAWLAQSQRADGARSVQLGPLGRDLVGELLAGLLSGPVPAALLDEVFRRGEGNPFFTEQLVAAMTAAEDATQAELPQRLIDFLRERLRATSSHGARLLEAVAVAARPMSVRDIVRISGLDDAVARRELAKLAESNLVEVSGAEQLEARHALVNEAVLHDLPATDRVVLHRRVAAVLAETQAEALAAEIAGHWHLAGDPTEELHWAEIAGNVAWRMGVYKDAAHWLNRAVSLSQSLGERADAEGPNVIDLTCRAVRAMDLAGEWDQAKTVATAAIQRYRDWPVPLERARLMLRVAHQQIVAGNRAEGVEHLAEVLALLERLPPGEDYVEALLLQASTLMWDGHSVTAIPSLERAMALAETYASGYLAADVAFRLAQALEAIGEEEHTATAFEHAYDLAARSGEPRAIVTAAAQRSDSLLVAGRLEEALRTATDAIEYAEVNGLTASWRGHLLVYNATEAALELGRTDIAARLITDLTDHPLRSDHVLDELRAEVDLRTGHAETGMTRLVRPSAEWTIDNLAAWATHRVWLCRWAKNPVQALADGLAVAEQARGTDADYQSGLLAACAGAAADVAVAARARRDPDRFASAQAALDRLTALTGAFAGGTRQRVQKRAEELEQHAEYQRANGDHAVAPWTAAAHEWTRLERPHRAAYAWWRLAEELLSGDPDPTAAREVLQRGFEDSEGHLPLRQAITDLAHRAHLRLATHSTERGGADTASLPVHLTEREVTVLRLVAEGMTNVEIGEHLFISPKTVSVHVSNILPKLNVRSRVQAAAWADQVGLVRRPTQ